MPLQQFAMLMGEDQPQDAAQDAGWVAGPKVPSSPSLELDPVHHDKKKSGCSSLCPPFHLSTSFSLSLFPSSHCRVAFSPAPWHVLSVCFVSSGLFTFSLKSLSDYVLVCTHPSLSVSLSISLLSASACLFFFFFLCIYQSFSASLISSVLSSMLVPCLPPIPSVSVSVS